MSQSDDGLVERLRRGDRDAFGQIVERYQNLICSLAYSSTGSLIASEELAQETFIAAWRAIRELRDPQRLRQWLCGILRNLLRNSARRRQRDLLHQAAALESGPEPAASVADPLAASIAREEAALMDRTLQAIPEIYREPLVLYYREQQSVAAVAELLGLSEDAVKQRLARGRKLLRDEIAVVLERGLEQTAPGRSFTMAVMAALPTMTGTAKAATLTATGVKGAHAMHAAGWTGMLGAIAGPILGIAGAWFGFKMSLKAARSERERAFIKRATKWVIGLAVVFSIGLTVLVLQGPALVRRSPLLFTFGITTLVLAYTLALLAFIIWMNRRQARIRLEDGTSVMPTEEIAAQMPAVMRRWQYPAVYESRLRLLGLPLVSIRFNGVNGTLAERRPALGWIAIGDVAIGVLFASGSLAIGGIACGALGLGVFSFAGLAFGFFAAGGGAVGVLALGGFATGILASGGIALAWHAAKGGAAVARNLAIGGLAVAENANDAVAKHFLDDHWFFQLGDLMATHGWLWFGFVALMLVPVFWARQVVTSGVGRS